jgi:uncharacterized protein YbdZ (MbtH family)
LALAKDFAEREMAALPAGWEQQFDEENTPFYIDHVAEQTTYVNPVEAKRQPLPPGWEERMTGGQAVFVNHSSQVTTFMVRTQTQTLLSPSFRFFS